MIFTSPHLVYCCPTAAKAPGGFLFPYVLQDFLRRARQYSNLRPSLFVVILLQGHRQTWRDSGETKLRFYKGSVFLRGQGGTGIDTRSRSDIGWLRALHR
jgi:hypothetical protein